MQNEGTIVFPTYWLCSMMMIRFENCLVDWWCVFRNTIVTRNYVTLFSKDMIPSFQITVRSIVTIIACSLTFAFVVRWFGLWVPASITSWTFWRFQTTPKSESSSPKTYNRWMQKIVLRPPMSNLCLRKAAAILSSAAREIPITHVEACCWGWLTCGYVLVVSLWW